ncbi:MAG: glycosyltransferase family 4 protein [Cyanobacteria bacterium P01_H01_bin.15]
MLKSLLVTRYRPYPPIGGSSLRNWQTINALAQWGQVTVFSVNLDPIVPQTYPSIHHWAHHRLTEINWQDRLGRRLWPLRPWGQPDIDRYFSSEAWQALKRLINSCQPDLIVVAEVYLFAYLWRLKKLKLPLIFDNHNAEANLFEQTFGKTRIQLPRMYAVEKACLANASQAWVCSEQDAQILGRLYGLDDKTHIIPNTVNVQDYAPILSGTQTLPPDLPLTPHQVIFTGTYNYPPNGEAARILIEQIYPQLKQRYSDCRLLLVGLNPTGKMREAADKDPDIVVTGRVETVAPYLAAASVMVLPLQAGSGTRLKILEAFAAGLPVVTTPKGIEGIRIASDQTALIHETAEQITAAITELWNQPERARKLAGAAYKLVNAEYSWEANQSRIAQALQTLPNIAKKISK